MKIHFFTLGQAHTHELPNGDEWNYRGIVQVYAKTENQARELIVAIFGLKWSTSYTEETITMEHYPRGVVYTFWYDAFVKKMAEPVKSVGF